MPAQAGAKQAGIQTKRFDVAEEVECSGQKARARLVLSCPERRVSVSVVAALLLQAFALLRAWHHVLFGMNQLLETNLRERDQTAPDPNGKSLIRKTSFGQLENLH